MVIAFIPYADGRADVFVGVLQEHEIAGPIQTSNGLHIIRLLAQRSITTEQNTINRQQVEQLLLQRKFEEHVQNWVSKMRSQAFINVIKVT